MESRKNDWWRRGLRTLIQLVAGGGLTALSNQLGADFEDYGAYIMIGSTALVSMAQNFCEDQGWIYAILKSKPSSGQNPVPGP